MGQTSRKADFNDSNPLGRVFSSRRGPPGLLVGVIVLGTLATSAAGCVINDLWDRDIDPFVERTRDRPLASRALTVKTGIGVALISFACAAILAFYLNSLSFWLCVTAVPVIIGYPLAKMFFPVPQSPRHLDIIHLNQLFFN